MDYFILDILVTNKVYPILFFLQSRLKIYKAAKIRLLKFIWRYWVGITFAINSYQVVWFMLSLS